MQRVFLFIFLLQFGLLTGSAQSLINIDNDWKFHFGHAGDPVKDFNYSIGTIFSKTTSVRKTAIDGNFNDSSWQTVQLPHDWAVALPFVKSTNFDVTQHGYKPVGGLFPETSIGWYRKHFLVAKSDSGNRFQIQFDGVFRDANFWINGFYLGNNKSGYIGATYDITDFINYNKDNVITVRVDATQYEGWFYEGAGIYRHVWLKKQNNIHIANDGLFTYSKINGTKTALIAEIEVENKNFNAASATVQTTLYHRDGKKVAQINEQAITIAAGQTSLVKQQLLINQPRLWSLEDPYLYRVVVTIKQNGKMVDELVHRFGFRTVDITPSGVFLNGKYLKLKGTNNHQDHAGVGSALPDYLQYYRIRLLKEMGCNSIRTSHHAPTPELIDACDSLGMLVMDETRLLNSSGEYLQQFKKLLRRDRNRTSVFIWSIGNEEGYVQTNSLGKRIAQSLLAVQKEIDPTRTSTYGADLPNVYKGINEVIPVRGFNYREYGVEDYHKAHPEQPIMGTEMGSTVTTRGIYERDTIRCYVPDKDLIAPWWASTAEKWWTLAADNKFWLGGYIWTGFDYRGEPTPYEWPNISSHFGVMDMCGFPKNLYYYYQSWWTDKDVLHILPHWNWPGKEGKPIDVWVFSNAEKVELFLNGKSLGMKEMPRNRNLKWMVDYEPGVLRAVAYKEGKTFTAQRETTGAPAGVQAIAYKTTMLADGKDATVINVSVVDKQHREIPDANHLIRFAITGDAKIIGVGNGDPSSHEPDKCEDGKWQRQVFSGKCQIIVQAGNTPGTVKLIATSDSLWKGEAEIFTIPVQRPLVVVPPKTQRKKVKKEVGKIIGADISFLPQLEARGIKFSDGKQEKDAILILKENGFNYIRLRIFNNPAADSGYSPVKGFCDLQHTLAMAKRVKDAGMKLLLDFHYSDYWADPGKQYKPKSWKQLPFDSLKDSVYVFTKKVIKALQQQGTAPEMVQIGNEINHGFLWPDGHVSNYNGLAELYKAGADAVLDVEPSTIIMLHIALGGQNEESVAFIDNMIARGVEFDVIGQSYYPQWHGTLGDLKNNLHDLINRYKRDLILVEYSSKKEEVNDIVFNLPDGRGKGTFIWEPLNTWEYIFEPGGKANNWLNLYKMIDKKQFGSR